MKHTNLLLRSPLLLACLALAASSAPAQEATKVSSGQPEFAAMQHLEDTWSDALVKHDQYSLEMVLAPSFVDISATGDVTTRNQQITRLLLKEISAVSMEQKVASVRMFGDLAVVNGTYILQHRVNGQAVDEKGIFSHVFQRVRTNWQCINSQRTVVVEQAVTPAKKKQQSKSSAELPFHIPLIHPGAKSDQQQPPPQSDAVPLPH